MAVEVMRAAVVGTALVTAGTAVVLIGTAVVGMALPVAGMVGVVAGTMVVTAAVGELVPRLASVLALEYSEERWQPPLIMVAMITATITRPTSPAPDLGFGIGAMPIRAIILRYRNARFRGSKWFSSARAKPHV
jgi:hypothetical protein